MSTAECIWADRKATATQIYKWLDDTLDQFARRPLDEAYPCWNLDARCEKVREAGVIRPLPVLIAIGINWEGQRQVLAIELANRESQSSWKDSVLRLKQRGALCKAPLAGRIVPQMESFSAPARMR